MASPSQRDAASGMHVDALDVMREVILTGVAVLVPGAISAYVLWVIFGALHELLLPVATVVFPESEVVGTVFALFGLVGVILLVGLVAHFRTGKQAIHYVDAAIGRVPGVGTIYRSFRRMSDVMLESDADHFQDVKLVAFPHEHAYTIGFVTAATPEDLARPVGESEMVTLFVPMSPNPVMGGFVINVPRDHVYDVDMSVEDGIRAIVTSGVTLDDRIDDPETFEAPSWELPHVGDVRGIDVNVLNSLDAEELRQLEAAVEERLLEVAPGESDDEQERNQ